jgi:hypothetical protein
MVTKSEIVICCGMFLLGIILLTGAMPKDAKAVVCRGNLKNLFQTVQLYADSNNGYLPPYSREGIISPSTAAASITPAANESTMSENL